MRIAGPVLASSRLRRLAAVGLLAGLFLLQGCATPTDYRSWERGQPVYYVKGGDTLYSIAVANDLDWQRLARWNGISNPRHLKIGQRLRLSPPGGAAVSAGGGSAPAASRTPVKTASSAPKPGSSAPAASPVNWKWPLEGRVLHRFPEGAPAQKGVILAASIDTPVRAAAGGRVVYSGDGLPGYGNLVIVKHNAEWLSAYAYNKSLAVSEGEEVRRGQTIARVGARDHRKPERGGHLLFQIRRQGKPVDPERYLP
ncbi:peptidoglycan DD-metalloendopeptidase family protein [Guyparkeria halophila]|uniref:Peptidoglycan DD-metalloendopeptidase family protein n=1 Tax=Guyparkeria halophila TaxID=47960 RepID=A0A6I6CY23_9GAMM|nr:peptidoglycan DD-metalloendopeptidase family protein [Guyparkeria halophila]QGT79099.1 peptidoglycan DD-metalloendopeptidase family protein [Guyparkeria halophila]